MKGGGEFGSTNSASDQNPKNEVGENSGIEDARSPYKNEVSSRENEITEVRDDDKRFRNGIGKERGACSMWAIAHDERIRRRRMNRRRDGDEW